MSLFTREQLPKDKVIMLVKANDGEELGCMLDKEEFDDADSLFRVFCGLVSAVEEYNNRGFGSGMLQ